MGVNSIELEEPRRVAYDLVYNESGEVIAVEVEIDGTSFELGKTELWDLHRIYETCFDTILEPEK